MAFPGEIGEMVLSAKRLLLSPAGMLWELPFAALVVNHEGSPQYLGAKVPITYTQSLAVLQQAHQVPTYFHETRLRALVVGDPLFRAVEPNSADPTLHTVWAGFYQRDKPPPRLGSSADEAQKIAAMYQSVPLLGAQATESNVRQQIKDAAVVHLATHGVLDQARPMSSGLIFTPPTIEPQPDDTGNDGILQAWEIFSQLKLRADIVVLSACDTARGHVEQSEGIVGLTRALQYAGARSVVATQWAVAEGDATAELMEAFHSHILAGMPKDEALGAAMKRIAADHPHPFYWAPFILVGDPGKLELKIANSATR